MADNPVNTLVGDLRRADVMGLDWSNSFARRFLSRKLQKQERTLPKTHVSYVSRMLVDVERDHDSR